MRTPLGRTPAPRPTATRRDLPHRHAHAHRNAQRAHARRHTHAPRHINHRPNEQHIGLQPPYPLITTTVSHAPPLTRDARTHTRHHPQKSPSPAPPCALPPAPPSNTTTRRTHSTNQPVHQLHAPPERAARTNIHARIPHHVGRTTTVRTHHRSGPPRHHPPPPAMASLDQRGSPPPRPRTQTKHAPAGPSLSLCQRRPVSLP